MLVLERGLVAMCRHVAKKNKVWKTKCPGELEIETCGEYEKL